MNELFPIASGILVGAVLPLVRPQTRVAVGVLASVALGTLATVVSGESRLGWEFLLVDVPLVALCCSASFVTVQALRRRALPARS